MKFLTMVHTGLLAIGLIVLMGALAGAEPLPCEEISPEARFVDRSGDEIELASLDPMTMRQIDSDTIVVYRRTEADAAALVETLRESGEVVPDLLDPETWLAQAVKCQMRAGSCKGNCLGKQKCKKIKKIGKNECTCMLD